MFNTTHISRAGMIGAVLAGVLAHPSPAAAQLDPLLFLKLAPPNVIVAVDTSNRMQRGVSSYTRGGGAIYCASTPQ